MTAMKKPSIGRVVHFRTERAACQYAQIAAIHSATVITVGGFDPEGEHYAARRVAFGELVGTWHWPEYVSDKPDADELERKLRFFADTVNATQGD